MRMLTIRFSDYRRRLGTLAGRPGNPFYKVQSGVSPNARTSGANTRAWDLKLSLEKFIGRAARDFSSKGIYDSGYLAGSRECPISEYLIPRAVFADILGNTSYSKGGEPFNFLAING